MNQINNIIGNVSAGGVILNDYVIKVEDIPGGHRLQITRGSEVQIIDIMDHDLTISGGKPGQLVGFDEHGSAVPVDPTAGVTYVSMTATDAPNRYTASMTGAEIAAAHDAGEVVCCVLDNKILPLMTCDKTVHETGVLLSVDISFSLHWGGMFQSVWMSGANSTDATLMDNLGGVLHADTVPIIVPALAQNKGKIFYVDNSGELVPVKLNSAFKVEDGELKVQHLYMQYGVPKIVPLGEITLVDTANDTTKYALRVNNGNLTITEVQ